MRPRISKRIPIIPRGSRIPWKPSTMNSSGISEITSRSGVMLFVKAERTTLSTSSSLISLDSLGTGIIPCVGSICNRFAGRPTLTLLIDIPAFSSASFIADLMASAAVSISIMIPSFTPELLTLLTPITFILPLINSATKTLIELVPISNPVKKPSLAIYSTSLSFQSITIKNCQKQNYSENIIP